jgi:hypothetical protein
MAEPEGSLDAGKHGEADAARQLAAQATLIVEPVEKRNLLNFPL